MAQLLLHRADVCAVAHVSSREEVTLVVELRDWHARADGEPPHGLVEFNVAASKPSCQLLIRYRIVTQCAPASGLSGLSWAAQQS